VKPEVPRYDRTTIILHWTTAILVALLWTIGQTIDFFPKGTPRIGARSAHILIGVTLLLIVIARLAWRIGWGRRLPAAVPGLAGRLAKSAHVALYLLLAATLVLGVSNAWIRGDNILGLFTIPCIAPGNKGLRERVEDLHGTLANITVIVAALHAAAALVHHFMARHDVLHRMLSIRKVP
jgi:cytochrome b561